MTMLYIDGNACPVKEEVFRVAERHGLESFVVANQWMRLPKVARLQRIVVDDGADAADDWIAERAGPADIVVTADIPLAARCLKAGAQAIGPSGRPFTEDNIASALAMRDLMSHLRDTGESKGGGPPSFARQDRSKFLRALEIAVQWAKR